MIMMNYCIKYLLLIQIYYHILFFVTARRINLIYILQQKTVKYYYERKIKKYIISPFVEMHLSR